jgi:hypothetical protein
MKSPKAQAAARIQPEERKPQTGQRTFNTQVSEGDVIHFDPTGEQLRVTKIEKGRITFEKLP